MEYWRKDKEGSCNFLHLISVDIYKKEATLKLESGKQITMKGKELIDMLSELSEFVFQNTATKREKQERESHRKDISNAITSAYSRM